MDKYITDYVNKCVACQATVFKQTPELIRISKLPDYPWSQITIAFYGASDEILLVLMDMYSCNLIVEIMRNISAQLMINKFNKVYVMFGCPTKSTKRQRATMLN